jgi:predicted Zn-dependent protease
MDGGAATTDDMIRSTRRGILVTRLWYVRVVEPMQDLYTGMTRDGTFLMENGARAWPVKNLRFNESVVRVLNSIEMLGPQETVGAGVWARVPCAKAAAFHFTSTTQF